MSQEQIILNAVEENRQEIIDFIQKIVQIPSVTGDEAAIGDAFYQGAKEWGLDDVQMVEAEPGHPNILARVKGQKDGPTLMFNGHMDVITPGPVAEWTYPPYSGAIVDGRMYGRGSVDMKSGTCSSFLAAAIIKKLGIPLKGDVLLSAVCDEEICGDRGVCYLLKEGYLKKTHPDDMGINCEPSKCQGRQRLVIAHKGILRAHIVVYGKNAHGARPWLGINAIDQAVKVVNRIHLLEEKIRVKHHPLLNAPSIMVAMMKGGSAMNMLPGTCTVSVTRRLLPGESKAQAIRDYQDILDALAAEDAQFKAELQIWKGFRPPLDIAPDSPIVHALQKAYRAVKGTDLPVAGEEAGTDASFVVEATGIPMPVFGPGDIALCAALDECVELDDIIDAIKTYALAIYYALGSEA